jgi:hypothetical protein
LVPTIEALKVADRFAADVVATGQDWIAASAEPSDRTGWQAVAQLFNPGECLSVVTEAVQAGEKWKPAGAGHVFTADYVATKQQRLVLRGFSEAAGAWVRINPVKPGSRGASDEDVASFRHVLLESDSLPIGLQIKVLWRLRELGLPVALLVHSGGGSVHAWVRVDCPDAESYKATVARLLALPLGFDPKNKNPSRLSRWPNVKRGSGLQSCVFIDPNVNALDEATLSRIEETVAGEGCAVSPVVDALAIEPVPDASAGAAVESAGVASPQASQPAQAVGVVDFSALDERRIRLECPPPVPVPVFKLAGQTICTAGNLAAIAAQAKSGKSATVGAMLSSLLCAGLDVQLYDEPDTLGFTAEPHQGRAVVLFDTEQSARDSWSLVRRAVDRAGAAALPDNVRAYRLLDVPTKKRRAWLSAELERASIACGGVHVVLLDGVADLCIDPNDAAEAFGLVDELVQLAVRFDCPFVCVLHENPALPGQGGKTRGHLGSQLERKAESNLRLEKDDAGVSVIYSTRCRNGDLPKPKGVTFAWSDELKMHVTVERTAKDKAGAKLEGAAEQAREAFRDAVGVLTYAELKARIVERLLVSLPTAEKRITAWKSKFSVIQKTSDGYLLA